MSQAKEAFAQIQERFDGGADLGDMSAVYLFELDADAGNWTLRIADGKGSVEEGVADDATCTIKVSADNFVNMVNKKANPQMLFMTGKLKVSGNMGQALKLQKIL